MEIILQPAWICMSVFEMEKKRVAVMWELIFEY
jgi:hypothetical protein